MFGENFPYTNFHDLNMDWIIKIAKDFLDQYTHIQQIIADGEESLQELTTSGLQQLQDKADNLEALLQAWYSEHSQDIANQLATALSDLNDWYTTHQNYLDNTLAQNILAFDTHAEQKAQETIASIPADYTELSNNVIDLQNLITHSKNLFNKKDITTGYYYYNGSKREQTDMCYYKAYLTPGATYAISGLGNASAFVQHYASEYDTDYISSETVANNGTFTVPATALYTYVSVFTEFIPAVQVELGSSATNYVPYYDDFKYPKEIDTHVIHSRNLYNKKEIVKGYYYYNGSKRELADMSYYKAYLIPGETYTVNGIGNTQLFVQHYAGLNDTNYISSVGITNNGTFTVPSNALYTYLSAFVKFSNTIQIERGTTPTEYQDYGYELDQGIYVENKKVPLGKNVYNKNGIVNGYWYYNGSRREQEGLCYYKAYLQPGKTYIISGTYNTQMFVQHYSEENDIGYISSEVVSNGQTFSVPASAMYTYLSVYTEYIDYIQVELGTVVTSYQRYGYKLNPGIYLTDDDIPRTYIVDGNLKLKDVLAEAVKYKNSTVYVKKNIDVLQELGSDYIENYSYPYSDEGLFLYNGVHLIFDTDVVISANYTGSNSDFITYWSVFTTWKGAEENSWTIENMHLNFSNIRYGIHDELAGRNHPGTHIVKNCHFNCGSRPAIGTGSGLANTYIYEGLVIDNGNLFWHQSILGDGTCEVRITNCYAPEFAIYTGGDGTVNTNMIISNCLTNQEIITHFSREYTSNNGLRLFKYNNVVLP